MISITEWQRSDQSIRGLVLKKLLSNQIQWNLLKASEDRGELKTQWEEVQKNSKPLILVDEWVGDYLLSELKQLSLRAYDWGCMDAVWWEGNQWWPDCFVRNVLFEMIIQSAPDLDILSAAYVSGSGGMAKMALSVVAQLGYTRIYFISDDANIEEFISEWKRRHFGVEIKSIEPQYLTLQPAHGSIFINTMPYQSERDWHNDLLYMNFLMQNSLVIDLDKGVELHPLIQEASESQFRTLSGVDVHCRADVQLLERLGVSVTLENYKQEWVTFIKNQT